jgi:hypothetical protein
VPADVLCIEAARERRLARVARPFACVHAEARPGLLLIHVPRGWDHVELTPREARVWLEQLGQLIDSAEELENV